MPSDLLRLWRPAFVLAFCCLVACGNPGRPVQMGGSVFGTSWSLTYLGAPDTIRPEQVRGDIEAAFARVNKSMNHYDETSLISAFNAAPAGVVFEVDWDFTYVLKAALTLSGVTAGAYDVTVSPLSDLWGFGPDGPRRFPESQEVEQAMAKVGLRHLEWQPGTRSLEKRVPDVALDFSSLAKGYAVDLAADALDDLGVADFMLEVGGEVRVQGNSPRGDAWRIAIERPEHGVRGGIQAALTVSEAAIATSGDYRNFFEHNGQRYSHLIDPRSGYPVQHDVVSVTVVHGSAMMADAWATALTVVGSSEAMALAESRGLAVYLLKRSGEDVAVLRSPAMKQWLEENAEP
jgi:FAD:protein FMN transferase